MNRTTRNLSILAGITVLSMAPWSLARDASGQSFALVKKQVDTMKAKGLVHKPSRLAYIINPRLRGNTGFGYTPYASPPRPGEAWSLTARRFVGRRKSLASKDGVKRLRQRYLLSLAECGVPAVAELMQRSGAGTVKIFPVIEKLMDDFFGEFSRNRPSYSSLGQMLEDEGGLTMTKRIPLATVDLRFWVEAVEDQRPVDNHLCCRFELRAFKVVMAPDPTKKLPLPNLTHCELVFMDSAQGRVKINDFPEKPEDVIRAVVCDALSNKVAVNFCLSPTVQSIFRNIETPKLDIQGNSISRKGGGR